MDSQRAFIVDQKDIKGGEEKAMLGFKTPEEAKHAYLAHMKPDNFGGMKEVSLDELKHRVSKKPSSLPNGEVAGEEGKKYIAKTNAPVTKIIAVDFDDTIAENRYPDVGMIEPGAIAALNRLKNAGYSIMIYSSRTGSGHPHHEEAVAKMKKFLDDNKVPYDTIHDGTGGKPLADYYIDDKGVPYQGSWETVVDAILPRKKY
jgi:hypothetical protein